MVHFKRNIQFAFILAACLVLYACSLSNNKSQVVNEKNFAKEYAMLIPHENVIQAGYNFVWSHDPESDRFIGRIYIPEDKVLIDYTEYEDESFQIIHGIKRSFYPNGNIASETIYQRGMKEGPAFEYHYTDANVLKANGRYVNDKKYDEWRYFYPDGRASSTYMFIEDQRHGPYVIFNKSGKIVEEGMYIRDKVKDNTVSKYSTLKSEEQSLYKEVEEKPEYPGCENIFDKIKRDSCQQAEMLKFIYSNLRYPAQDRMHGIEGLTIIKFTVDNAGLIRNIYGYKVVTRAMEKAAIDVVKKMPVWHPGKQKGQPVNVEFTLPVRFKLA